MMLVTLVNGDVRQRSTQAAQEYVRTTRNRLEAQLASHGPGVRQLRSYQQLERSIAEVEVARMWPLADLDAVFEAEPG